jgi:hypothetical protein
MGRKPKSIGGLLWTARLTTTDLLLRFLLGELFCREIAAKADASIIPTHLTRQF